MNTIGLGDSSASKTLFGWLQHLPLGMRSVLLVGTYLLAGLGLEKLSAAFESAEGITPWDPSAGLHFVLLLGFGLRYTPELLFIPLLTDLVLNPLPIPPVYVLIGALSTTLGYSLACTLLLHQLHLDPCLRRLHDVFWFSVVAGFIAPLVVATCYVTTLAVAGDFAWSEWPVQVLSDWAGEATGIMMLAPPLLILLRAVPGKGLQTQQDLALEETNSSWSKFWLMLEWGAELVALVAISWAAFGVPLAEYLDYTYFVFVPIIWMAMRHGFEKVSVAVLLLDLSVALFVQAKFGDSNPLALQFGLTTASHAGLLLGAIVTERRQAEKISAIQPNVCKFCTKSTNPS